MAQETESVSITEKLKSLISTAESWKNKMIDAAQLQNGIFTETHLIATQLKESLEQDIVSAQQLVDKLDSVGLRAAQIRAEWVETTGASSSALGLMQQAQAIRDTGAKSYISGASQLTDAQKTELQRIIIDQDKYALDALVQKYEQQINAIFTDEYLTLKKKRDALDKQQQSLGDQVAATLKSMKGKEGTGEYDKAIQTIKHQRLEMSRLAQQSANLTQQIAQFDEKALKVQGQLSVTKGMWNDETMRRNLESGNEKTGAYTKEELQWLIDKALAAGGGEKLDKIALQETIKKVQSAEYYRTYKLDLTAGDQKLSAFTDVDPQKFLEALLKARGTAI